MQIYKLTGRNVDVTDALRDYVESKLTRLDRFNDHITDARVTLMVRDVRDADRRNRVEVQINVPNGILRAEENHADMYAAIDRASEVLERQLRKFKTRYLKGRHAGSTDDIAAIDTALPTDDVSEFTPEIVRTKRFDMRPMTAEDAVAQMEALGHDFYVFMNAGTNSCAVVYRRKDGHFGLIEPRA